MSTSARGLDDGSQVDVPGWLRPLADRALRHADLPIEDRLRSRALPVEEADVTTARRSAVLILFGEGPAGPDLLLVRRETGLRHHGGQPAFPGGGADPADVDPTATALREAAEETGLEPSGVTILGALGDLWMLVSNNVVTPVVGWWHAPVDVYPADPREIAAVARVPLRDLVDPRNRGIVPVGEEYEPSPAFEVSGMSVWGFTAVIISALLVWLGMEQPWDERVILLPPGDAGPVTATVDL